MMNVRFKILIELFIERSLRLFLLFFIFQDYFIYIYISILLNLYLFIFIVNIVKRDAHKC